MNTVTLPFTPPSEDDLKREVYTLAVQLRIETYGEELANTPAVDKLGYLLSFEDKWRRYCGYPVRAKSVKVPREDLLILWDAMKAGDAKFFANLSKAIEQRKKPAHIDNVRTLDYILEQYIAWRRSKRGPITL